MAMPDAPTTTTPRFRWGAEGLLFLAALIWGLGFVAQREGMQHIGPFAFNAVRYLLAAVCLIPLLFRRRAKPMSPSVKTASKTGSRLIVKASVWAGCAMFLGSAFQQSGIVETSAGKTGFITGLYTVIVPVIAVLRKDTVSRFAWIGAVLAATGLYFLSVTGDFRINRGDLLVFIGAFCWAGHVIVIGHFSNQVAAIPLAIGQCLVTSALSFAGAFVFEQGDFSGIRAAAIPILYAGCLSISVGFTLQILGQRHAKPTPAAIIMSLEAVFAAIGGWLMLNEVLDGRSLFGCALMLAGMITAQLNPRRGTPPPETPSKPR